MFFFFFSKLREPRKYFLTVPLYILMYWLRTLPLVHLSGTSCAWPIPLATNVRRTSVQSVPLGCIEAAAHRSRHPAKITTTAFPEAILIIASALRAHSYTNANWVFSTVCYTCGTNAPVRFSTLRSRRVTLTSSVAKSAKWCLSAVSGFCLVRCIGSVAD